MVGVPHKEELLRQSAEAFEELTHLCSRISAEIFFRQPATDQWSIAQHVQHLVISTRTATAPYALPKFIVGLIGGRARRPGMSYEELVQRYKDKLAAGGKARGRYVPSPVDPSVGRDNILLRWTKATALYRKAMQNNCSEEQLDRYTVPHPLLGRITLRELAFFTICHTHHHIASISKLLSTSQGLNN